MFLNEKIQFFDISIRIIVNWGSNDRPHQLPEVIIEVKSVADNCDYLLSTETISIPQMNDNNPIQLTGNWSAKWNTNR